MEIIVAGIDPIRHVEQPGIYYMDSAQSFALKIIDHDVAVAGNTAAITAALLGHNFSDVSTSSIKVLAKECFSATKLRWPLALQNHVRLGVITPQTTRIENY